MHTFMIAIILILILVLIYLTTRFHKLEIINNTNNKRLSWIIAITPIIIGILLTILYGLTTIIIILHLAIFFTIGDVLYLILKKKIKYIYIGIFAIISTTGYIVYAWINANDIKKTDYVIYSDKIDKDINIIQITDIHIGNTLNGNEFSKYIDDISNINPDILVITGDFVDESTSYNDMITAIESLGKAKTKYGIYMIFGNHDLNIYGGKREYTDEQLISLLNHNNITILQDEITLINNEFYLIGRKDKNNKNRLELKDIIKNIDKTKLIINLDHQPVHFSENQENSIDVMLSGHTHGGQMFPLALISEIVSDNEMTYGIKNLNGTTFIVSSGMSGWGIPLKTDTINEYVNITIK